MVAEVASPFVGEALLMVATAWLSEDQVTCEVRFWVELSVYVPVAVNCCVVPRAMLGAAGVTWTDTSSAGVAVTVVLPEIPSRVAEMTEVPVLLAVTDPAVPAVLLAVATAVSLEPRRPGLSGPES